MALATEISTEDGSGATSTRRDFLIRSALAAAAAPLVGAATRRAEGEKPAKRPNVLLVISDQYRWDFICAYGRSPMDFTPNLDAMFRRGTAFQNAFTNQPLCSPARSCLFTGQYATRTGVWTLGPGLQRGLEADCRDPQPPTGLGNLPELRRDVVTLATELRRAGYSANYIGKWHLAPNNTHAKPRRGLGYVPPEERGGFLDLWQASNVLELTSHPYEGTIWDGQGGAMTYQDRYRVDYLTDLAVKFLRRREAKPFFLVLSQLEPHQQNDMRDGFVPPKGYAERFRNPYAPPDVRPFPGNWPFELADYYGDCKSIDESMGMIFRTLQEENLEENTIVVFLSDHGCHFRTRNGQYKCTPHDSSTHIPLIIQGPGFNHSRVIAELVSLVDVAPSLLAALGLPIPASMQGRNFIPLINDAKARAAWRNEVFIQVSYSETTRALRTPEWTYAPMAPDADLLRDAGSMRYQDYRLFNNCADPAQIVNLAGRDDPPELVHYTGERSMREIADHLRERLMARMVEAGEQPPQIERRRFYP